MNDEWKKLSESLKGICIPSSLHDLAKPPAIGGINPDVVKDMISHEELNERLLKRMDALEQAVERGPKREWYEHPVVLMVLGALAAAVASRMIM